MAAKVRQERGCYWLVVHHDGRRTKRRFGPTKEDKRRAVKAAEEINHRLALGLHASEASEGEAKPLPLDAQLREWHRTWSPTFNPSGAKT